MGKHIDPSASEPLSDRVDLSDAAFAADRAETGKVVKASRIPAQKKPGKKTKAELSESKAAEIAKAESDLREDCKAIAVDLDGSENGVWSAARRLVELREKYKRLKVKVAFPDLVNLIPTRRPVSPQRLSQLAKTYQWWRDEPRFDDELRNNPRLSFRHWERIRISLNQPQGRKVDPRMMVEKYLEMSETGREVSARVVTNRVKHEEMLAMTRERMKEAAELDRRAADDLWRLHNKDCLDVIKLIPDASLDLVFADPPFGYTETRPTGATTVIRCDGGEVAEIEEDGGDAIFSTGTNQTGDFVTQGQYRCGGANLTRDEYIAATSDFIRAIPRTLKPNAPVILFMAGCYWYEDWRLDAIKAAGLEIRARCEWFRRKPDPREEIASVVHGILPDVAKIDAIDEILAKHEKIDKKNEKKGKDGNRDIFMSCCYMGDAYGPATWSALVLAKPGAKFPRIGPRTPNGNIFTHEDVKRGSQGYTKHVWTMPVALAEDFILRHCPRDSNSTIFEPFGCSFPACKAAIRTGNRYIGCEKSAINYAWGRTELEAERVAHQTPTVIIAPVTAKIAGETEKSVACSPEPAAIPLITAGTESERSETNK